MVKNGVNGKTLVRLEQRLTDYINHNDKLNDDIKFDLKEIKNKLNNVMNILVTGEGKIKRNYCIIKEHEDNHKWWTVLIVSLVAIVVTLLKIIL